jgi:hypothetical protein
MIRKGDLVISTKTRVEDIYSLKDKIVLMMY